jgi:hypothetical protein
MSTLTAVQKLYLQEYSKHGKPETALEAVTEAVKQPVDRRYIMEWCNTSPEFSTTYKAYKRQVIQQLNEDNYILSLQRMNEQLARGYTTTYKLTTETITMPGEAYRDAATGEYKESEPKEVTKVKSENVQTPLSPALLKLAMGATALESAITKIANEGLLSENQYKQLMGAAAENTELIQNIFDPRVDSGEYSEDRAIAIIRQALIGTVEPE